MLALQNGMDVKTLPAMLGHVSAATALDIYTHITDDMQRTAAANIDRGIGKAAPQEGGSNASPAPAISVRRVRTCGRAATLPCGSTVKSTSLRFFSCIVAL